MERRGAERAEAVCGVKDWNVEVVTEAGVTGRGQVSAPGCLGTLQFVGRGQDAKKAAGLLKGVAGDS